METELAKIRTVECNSLKDPYVYPEYLVIQRNDVCNIYYKFRVQDADTKEWYVGISWTSYVEATFKATFDKIVDKFIKESYMQHVFNKPIKNINKIVDAETGDAIFKRDNCQLSEEDRIKARY